MFNLNEQTVCGYANSRRLVRGFPIPLIPHNKGSDNHYEKKHRETYPRDSGRKRGLAQESRADLYDRIGACTNADERLPSEGEARYVFL